MTITSLQPPLPSNTADLLEASPEQERAWIDFLRSDPEARSAFIQWTAREAESLLPTDAARALRLADLCLDVASLQRDQYELGLAHRCRAWALRRLSRFDEAFGSFQSAFGAFAAAGDDEQRARTAVAYVWLLRDLGRYEEALDAAARARPVLLAARRLRDAATLDVNASSVYRRLGMTARALELNQRSLPVFEQLGEDALQAAALNNIGNGLADLDEVDGALAAYERAASIYLRLGHLARAANLYAGVGELYQKVGRLDEALRTLSRASRLARNASSGREAAFAAVALSRTYASLNLLDEAREHNQRASAFYRAQGMPWEEASGLLEAAQLQARRGDLQQAKGLAAEAMSRFEEQAVWPYAAIARLVLASSFKNDPGAHKKGLALARQAQRVLRKAGWRSSEALSQLVQADLLVALERPADAQRLYAAAAGTGERYGIAPLAFSAHAGLGTLLRNRQPEEALEHYATAARYLEDGRHNLPGVEFRQAYAEDKAHVYEALAALHLDRAAPGSLAAAFAAIERAKSRALLDELSRGAERRSAGKGGQVSRASLYWHYSKLDQPNQSPEELKKLYAEARRLEAEVSRREREELALAGTSSQTGAVASLEEVRAKLTQDDVVLEYFIMAGEVICFEVTRKSAQVHRGLCDEAQVQQLTEQLRFQLGFLSHGAAMPQANREALERSQQGILNALFTALMAPLGRHWAGRAVTVMPHGVLHGVPFHALWDGERYVIEYGPVGYAPSATLFLRMSEGATGPIAKPLLVAPEDQRLPALQREVGGIAGLFPGALSLAGRKATAAALRRQASKADALHLATHAVFRSDNPSFSSFKLSRSWLLLREIPRLGLNARLAVLSACETGQVAVRPGDELVGLSQAFFQAGCRSLVASLWAVDDESTAALMVDFYRRLREGAGVGEALRGAQLALRDEYPSPYYWAPFVAIGQR